MKFNLTAQTSERNKKADFRHHQYMVLITDNGTNPKPTGTHINIESVFCQIKPNLDHNYTFQIHLSPSLIAFGDKSIGKI